MFEPFAPPAGAAVKGSSDTDDLSVTVPIGPPYAELSAAWVFGADGADVAAVARGLVRFGVAVDEMHGTDEWIRDALGRVHHHEPEGPDAGFGVAERCAALAHAEGKAIMVKADGLALRGPTRRTLPGANRARLEAWGMSPDVMLDAFQVGVKPRQDAVVPVEVWDGATARVLFDLCPPEVHGVLRDAIQRVYGSRHPSKIKLHRSEVSALIEVHGNSSSAEEFATYGLARALSIGGEIQGRRDRDRCFRRTLEDHSSDGGRTLSHLVPCDSWRCLRCARRMTRGLQGRLARQIATDTAAGRDRYLFVTLTTDPSKWRSNGEAAVAGQGVVWDRLRRQLERRFSRFSYLRVTEWTEKGRPHWHILIRGDLLTRDGAPATLEDLADAFRQCAPATGFGSVVYAKTVCSPDTMPCELFKTSQVSKDIPASLRRVQPSLAFWTVVDDAEGVLEDQRPKRGNRGDFLEAEILAHEAEFGRVPLAQAREAVLIEPTEALPTQQPGSASTRTIWMQRPTSTIECIARDAAIKSTFTVSESAYLDVGGTIVREASALEEVPHDRRDTAARVEDFLGLVQRWRFIRGGIHDDAVRRVVESLWRQHEGDG